MALADLWIHSAPYHKMQTVSVMSVREIRAVGLPVEKRSGNSINGRTDSSYVSKDSTATKNLLPSRRNGQKDKEKDVPKKTERQEVFQRSKSKSFPSAIIQKTPKSCCKTNKHSSPFRKTVHFADSFGLPLAMEISYYREQEIELFSSFEAQTAEWRSKPEGFGLKYKSIEVATPEPPKRTQPEAPKRTQPEVVFMFIQPSSESDFFTRVEKNNVCLENMKRDGPCIQGYVRVTNIAYHKKVQVRWTTDAWHRHQDTECTYSHTLQDSNTDCFTFKLPISGEQLELALLYTVNGQVYWDNNGSRNYKVAIKR